MRGVLAISADMLDNGVWRGAAVGDEGMVTLLSDVSRVIFPEGLNVKGLVSMCGTEVILGKASRIRHIRGSGSLLCLGDLLFADIALDQDLLVDGNIHSWLSGIIMPGGSVLSTGRIRSAGNIIAPNGIVVADQGVAGEVRPIDIKAIDVVLPNRSVGHAMDERARLIKRLEKSRRLVEAVS